MSSGNFYTWQTTDSLWTVAARFLTYTGFSNPVSLAEAIRAANPQILDWSAIPFGTQIYLPAVLIT